MSPREATVQLPGYMARTELQRHTTNAALGIYFATDHKLRATGACRVQFTPRHVVLEVEVTGELA